jgi:hypothetical protein
MRERISPTVKMHLMLSRRDTELGDDNLHDYVRAGLSGEMLWRIERRIAKDAPPSDRLSRLDESFNRLNAKMAEMLDHTAIDSRGTGADDD